MEERGGLTGCGEGVEGLWAGEGEARGSPGEREGAEGVSGAGRGAEAESGEESLGAGVGVWVGVGVGVGLAAAGLVAAEVGLMVAVATIVLPGLGAVGGPRGLGDTGGGTRFGSGQRERQRGRCQFSYRLQYSLRSSSVKASPINNIFTYIFKGLLGDDSGILEADKVITFSLRSPLA